MEAIHEISHHVVVVESSRNWLPSNEEAREALGIAAVIPTEIYGQRLDLVLVRREKIDVLVTLIRLSGLEVFAISKAKQVLLNYYETLSRYNQRPMIHFPFTVYGTA